VLALTAALATVGALMAGLVLRDAGPVTFTWVWLLLVLASFVGDVVPVHLHLGRQSITLTFSELPLALGLVLVHPLALLLARGAGGIAAFRAAGMAPAKRRFNTSLLLTETGIALWVFDLLRVAGAPPAGQWRAAFVATLAGHLAGHVAVLTVLRLNGAPVRRDPDRALLPLIGTLGNASIGGLGVLVLASDPLALALLGSVLVSVVVALRGHTRLRARQSEIEALHALTREMGTTLDEGDATRALLVRIRALLGADVAELVLLPDDGDRVRVHLGPDGSSVRRPLSPLLLEVAASGRAHLARRRSREPDLRALLREQRWKDAVVVPLGGPTRGILVVADRLGDTSTFSASDLHLLHTVADHASALLENGRLVARVREEAAAKAHQAAHDPLTGLANRTAFEEAVRTALTAAHGRPFAVLLLDLDRFKEVNDTLGHPAGDVLLREVAERLRPNLPAGARLARLGGDEFGVLLEATNAIDALCLGQELLVALDPPFSLRGLDVCVGASVGVALHPDHGERVDALVQRAEIAMYAAKAVRGGCALYTAEQDPHSEERLGLAADLRGAIERGELEVHYQPQVSLAEGTVRGVEALVRWHHPVHGPLPPDRFIPIAERTGLIGPLTQLVLDRALTQQQTWRKLGFSLEMAVNVDAETIVSSWFLQDLEARLGDGDGGDASLTLEVTESLVMADPDRAAAVLGRLRRLGVRVSVDDFGTGYSSFAQLRRLPVDQLKVDRSFVSRMGTDPSDAVIVRATVELAHNLGLRAVAEGVEEEMTWTWLRAMGCDDAQGYLVSRPLPADELTRWLLQRRPAAQATPAPAR
jgi:diguanylate cyclase (GGDEF)-like protein